MNRYAMVYLNVGSRTHGRDTFFCVAKRKYPKKRRPGCRLSTRYIHLPRPPGGSAVQIGYPANLSCAPRLSAGGGRRGFLPLCRRASSMTRPFGLNLPKAPVLGAANGKENPFND